MNEEENELILAQDKAQDKAQDEIVSEKISNMNEEEKKAIEKFENLLIKHFENKKIDTLDYLDYFEGIIILNLIEKQQKEIEDLKNDHIDFWINTKEVEDMVRGKFISKDKIKEEIENLKQYKEEIKDEKDTEYYTTLRIIKALRKLLEK